MKLPYSLPARVRLDIAWDQHLVAKAIRVVKSVRNRDQAWTAVRYLSLAKRAARLECTRGTCDRLVDLLDAHYLGAAGFQGDQQ